MEILQFAILGLGLGGMYALSAQGLVLIYRASGVVNFAQGSFVMVGGYTFYEAQVVHGLPSWLSLILALLAGVVLGLLVHYAVMRPMKNASPLTRAVATLGVLAVLQAGAVIWFGTNLVSMPSMLPTTPVHVFGVVLTEDRIILFFIGVVVTAVLWSVYRFTRFGQVTTAVAENERAASALGHSPDTIAGVNWVIGAVLATGAGALIAPITSVDPTLLNQVMLPAMAAALLGAFASFPLALVAALAIGAGQSVLTYEITAQNWWTGWSDALPFIVVILYLVARGRTIPLRGHIFDRLPLVGSGRIRVIPVLVVSAAAIVIMAVLPGSWEITFTVTICYAIVCLSVIVVTGYAGQLSVAQYIVGATGAFVGAKLMNDIPGIPFELAFLISVVVAVLIGLVVGAPALRTRGINLAIVTLGIGFSLYALFLTNDTLAGNIGGIPIKPASLFGLDLNPSVHPAAYGITAIVVAILIALAIANLRRGTSGRRLLAVRSNERAALSLGVSVFSAKLYAFMVSSGIAAVGVCILAFINPAAVFSGFDIFTSISFVTSTVVGGLGMIGGGLIGSTLIPNGITSRFLSDINGTLATYLPLIGGVAVLLTLLAAQDGVFELNRAMGAEMVHKIGRRWSRHPQVPQDLAASRFDTPGFATTEEAGPQTGSQTDHEVTVNGTRPDRAALRVAPKELVVRGLTVRFGGVVAVQDMSLVVRPGTIHGLIGPNGAGKTTLIDAITGFVNVTSGAVELDGVPLRKVSARRRALLGLGRSFQSGELFSDLTIRENLAVAGDRPDRWRYITDFFWPGRIKLSDAAVMAAGDLRLEDVYDQRPGSLPFGRRRLVAIARSVAAAPSVLLLDEPASGLDPVEVSELAELIRHLAERWGIGILLVEHNLDMVLSVCDEITVMAEGKELLAASDAQTVRTHPDVVAAYVGVSDDVEAPS